MDFGKVLIYFVYGLSFYTLGICLLIQVRKNIRNFPLIRAFNYLGAFGIFHGFVEWMIAYQIIFTKSEGTVVLLEAIDIMKSISFAFLWIFGVFLINSYQRITSTKKMVCGLTILNALFLVLLLFNENIDSWILNWQGFFSAIFCGIGLFLAAKKESLSSIDSFKLSLNVVAYLFVFYGLSQITPALLQLNSSGFTLELIRTIIAIAVTGFVLYLIRLTQNENTRRLNHLLETQSIGEERKRLAKELHDTVLQDLFVIGIQLEQMQIDYDDDLIMTRQLAKIGSNLMEVMDSIREYLKTSELEKKNIHDLFTSLQYMVMSLGNDVDAVLEFRNTDPDAFYGFIAKEALNPLYYMVREAVINALKHASASRIQVLCKPTMNALEIMIIDDGKGFSKESVTSHSGKGMDNIKIRALEIQATVQVESNLNGTRVKITYPWESAS